MRPLSIVALLLLAAYAGCVTPAAEPEVETASATAPATLAAPAVDAAAVLGEIRSFSTTFPMRRGDNEAHNGARAYLLETYATNGYEAIEDEFEAAVSPTSTPTSLILGNGRLVNICGIKWGATAPQEWVVVGAHYDVTDGAIYGAYDDGSGTMVVQHLARAFAPLSTPRTIIFCNFDGEELGLRGSSHFVEAVTAGEWIHNNGTVVGMIDFDMAGIMYPAAPPLVADAVSPEFQAVITATRERLEIPEEAIEFRGISGGSSDNGPFKAVEIPSVLFISNFDDVRTARPAAMDVPGFYPFWHQFDSYEGMVELAGGEENLVAGFQNVIDIGADLLAALASDMKPTYEALG